MGDQGRPEFSSSAGEESILASSSLTFATAFSPLAAHLFPDGRPDHIRDDVGLRYLNNAWPERVDRSPITTNAAKAAVRALRDVATEQGLEPAEMFVAAVAACETLPTAGRRTGSALVDGTSTYFSAVIRCLIPRPVASSRLRSAGKYCDEIIPCQVISMLLSASSATERCDGRGRSAVLRFLTLALRSGCFRQIRARQTLACMYALPFRMLSDVHAVGDAVRLLHAITRRKHVKPHRARRVRELYDNAIADAKQAAETERISETSKRSTGLADFSPLLLLLQLYARYDPEGCGRYFPGGTRLVLHLSRYFRVPDTDWEIELSKVTTMANAPNGIGIDHASDSTVPHTAMAKVPKETKRDTILIGMKRQHPADIDEAENEVLDDLVVLEGEDKTCKKMRLKSQANNYAVLLQSQQMARSITSTIDRLEDAFEGVHSSSWELLTNGGNAQKQNRSVRASDLLCDATLRHIILLSSATESSFRDREKPKDQSGSTICDSEVIRLRVCLPHMLFEEWYGENWRIKPCCSEDELEESLSDDDGYSVIVEDIVDPKVRVIKSLALLARHTDMLPIEAENFIIDVVLPSWDGSDKIGVTLCNDLLPALKPMGFRDLKKKILSHLSKFYVCGSPRLKFAIVSGALANLVRRWGRLQWICSSLSKHMSPLEYKRKTLQEFIQWTDNLLLAGLIAEGGSDGSGHDLIRLSALDFYGAVCEICDECTFVASPSPALIYRLVLASAAVSIDRICALLLRYKTIFERMKAKVYSKSDRRDVLNSNSTTEEISGLEKVALFNCFIWDFCSILWRCSQLPSAQPDSADLARMNSILFTDIPSETLLALHHLPSDFKVSSALSITHGAVFSGFASDFLNHHYKRKRERGEEVPAIISPNLLSGSLKVKYLDHLKTIGFDGLHGFLTTFVGSLVEREKRKVLKNAGNWATRTELGAAQHKRK